MFKKLNTNTRILLLVIFLTVVASYVAWPSKFKLNFEGKVPFINQEVNLDQEVIKPELDINLLGQQINPQWELKQGLDIQGGMQVVLRAKMDEIAPEDREQALESARDVILRRVDLYGISEPRVQTSQVGDEYRIIVELAGVSDPNQALQLVGTTAQLSFKLQKIDLEETPEATTSPLLWFESFEETGLTGKNLKRSTVQFDPQTGQPVISLEFDSEGTKIFGEVTSEHVGEPLAIFIDDFPVTMPVINTPILTGNAQISGQFTVEEAKQLSIQLNAGALPVSIEVLQQRQIGASLGQESVVQSVKAGLLGLGLVMLFMIMYYGWKGVWASLGLVIYAILTIAIYKLLGIVLTLPGIAGLILSIGMAVDANILIFERMKEELRLGKPFAEALELGFGRSWDSIKDANLATIMTALVLMNPLELSFLPTSGLVRGFGVTLLIGVLVGLFTGVVVTRTLLRIFLRSNKQ
jgi:preprotein translocase subunit SecD